MLDVKNLTFSYNKNIVLDDLSFSVNKNEIIGLLGVNGAGKSTLLKCLGNIIKPKGGSVFINNKDICRLKRNTIAKQVSYVCQNSAECGFSVFESILMGRRPYFNFLPKEKDFELVEDLLSLLNLENFANRDVGDLSGGEYQKVVLARAIVQEPNLLLLDEPTNHLDIKNQFTLMDIFYHLVKVHGITSIISFHDINMAMRYADRLILLKDNKIHFYDKTELLTNEIITEVFGIDLEIHKFKNGSFVFPDHQKMEDV